MATTATPAAPAPGLALSTHLGWDPYYDNPGPAEKPNALYQAHMDALALLAPYLSAVRVDMGWSTSQPTAKPPTMSHYYNRRYQRLFADMAARHIPNPYVVVQQSPPWSRTPAWDPDAGALVNTRPKRFPDNPASITPWARWAVEQYGDSVKAWEVWNEPNLWEFAGFVPATESDLHTPATDPARYVRLLSAFHDGAKAASPAVKLIGGNMSGNDWVWLDGAYKAGLKDVCDIVGVHPYQGNQSVRPSSLDTVAIAKKTSDGKDVRGWERFRITKGLPLIGQVMARYNDGRKPLWATEVGWSGSASGVGSAGVPGTWASFENKSAAFLLDFLDMVTAGRDAGGAHAAYSNLRLVTVYQLFDPLSSSPHQKGFSVIGKNGAALEQARALRRWRQSHKAIRPLF